MEIKFFLDATRYGLAHTNRCQENISAFSFQLTRRHAPEYFDLHKNVNVDNYTFLVYFPSVLPLYAFQRPFHYVTSFQHMLL